MCQGVSDRCMEGRERISRILRWFVRKSDLQGESFLPVITSEEQLFRVTDAAIQFFDDYANPSERFRFTLERVGIDKFKEVIKEAYNG